MAKKVMIVDDMDGTEGAETIRLTFGEKTVELDLGPKNIEKVEKFLAPYFNVGRSAKTTVKKPKNSSPEQRAQLDAIRAWANRNGFKVAKLGRIPQNVMDAFNAAHAPDVSRPQFSSVT